MLRPALVRLLAVLYLALTLACGGRGGASVAPRAAVGGAATEVAYPVLRMVPAPVSYAVVAARVSDLSRALKELGLAVGMLADFEIAELNQELRDFFGTSLLVADEIAASGIAVDRSVALFSRELYPTLVIPVADKERLTEFLSQRMPERGVTVRRHRDAYEVYAWRPGEGEEKERLSDGPLFWVRALSWVVVEDWLVVHLGGSRTARDLTWLDDVLSVRPAQRLATDVGFRAAVTTARRYLPEPERVDSVAHPLLFEEGSALAASPGIVGFVRLERILPALRSVVPHELDPCWSALDGERGLFVFGANTRWDGADGVIAVELAAAAAESLSSAVADPPPLGFLAFREDSGLHASWNLGPAWLADLAERSGCELAWPFGEGLLDDYGGKAVAGGHLAGSEFPGSLQAARSGRAGVHLQLLDRAFAERLLEMVPQRQLLERDEKVNGLDVKVIRAPLLPEIAYRLDRQTLTVALGSGVMARLLAPAPVARAVAPGKEIGALGIWPQRLADLAANLAVFGALVTRESRERLRPFADRMSRRLARYEYGRLRLAIDGKSLILTGQMRLR